MGKTTKVSVLITAYNHERFIAKAVASALTQNTSFEYEIVIGDDCSTDTTQEILRQLRKKHPKTIRLILREQNIGALENYKATLATCRGEYVARLDGDDYWTSCEKLRKLTAFLDSHPDCPMCFHNVRVKHEKDQFPAYHLSEPTSKEFFTTEELLVKSGAQSSATMIRREVANNILDTPRVRLTDKARAVVASQYGDIGYVSEVMSVWRIHEAGAFSKGRTGSIADQLKKRKAHLEFFETMDQYFSYKYHHVLRESLMRSHYALAKAYLKKRDWRRVIDHVIKGFGSSEPPDKKRR